MTLTALGKIFRLLSPFHQIEGAFNRTGQQVWALHILYIFTSAKANFGGGLHKISFVEKQKYLK